MNAERDTHRSRRGLRRARSGLVGLLITAAAVGALLGARSAPAQSPAPGTFMEDSRPGIPYPSGASAVVVEGLGVLSSNCNGGGTYSQGNVESWTVSWITNGHRTFTEITPQSICGTIGQYVTLINQIKTYVEAYAANPGTYWGGFMLDEEPGYGFNSSQLQTLNAHVETLMLNTPGVSWYAEEDQPNGWVASTYNAILSDSWPAPQVYTSSMASAVNTECSTYGECTNLVTVDSQLGYPWDSPDYVAGLINGTPWSIWSGNWYNLWRPE